MCMSIYAGWKILDQFLPNLFIWFNIQAIFWYYLIRIAISMLIGAIATPIYLIYCIVRMCPKCDSLGATFLFIVSQKGGA